MNLYLLLLIVSPMGLLHLSASFLYLLQRNSHRASPQTEMSRSAIFGKWGVGCLVGGVCGTHPVRLCISGNRAGYVPVSKMKQCFKKNSIDAFTVNELSIAILHGDVFPFYHARQPSFKRTFFTAKLLPVVSSAAQKILL